MMTEGEIERALGVRRVTREIEKLKDHVIICGFGRMGQTIVEELDNHKQPLLVLDNHPENISEATARNCLVLGGNATDEDVLLQAGVERAATLVCGLPGDADNMYITLTARNLNPSLTIIARGEHPSSAKKLKQAGANQVVLPAVTGAQRIARMVTRPHTADLFERVLDRQMLDVELDEIRVLPSSPLAGQTVRDAETHRKHRLLVVAIVPGEGPMTFNPDEDYRFTADDTIIVMGRREDIQRYRETFEI